MTITQLMKYLLDTLHTQGDLEVKVRGVKPFDLYEIITPPSYIVDPIENKTIVVI